MQYTASHSVTCNASVGRVYDLIRRSVDWPQVIEPCESVTVLDEGEGFERVEIAARVNEELMTWQSRRHILPEVLGVDSTIVQPMKLVDAMRTRWRVVELNTEQSALILEHEYSLCADVAGQVAGVTTHEEAARFIESGIDRNSTRELGDFKAAVERADPSPDGRDFHSRHSVICAASADTVYGLIRSTETWPRIFDACLSAMPRSDDDTGELVRIEAIQDGRVVSWDTRRRYHDAIRRVDYDLPVPMPFLESMRGQWRVVPLDAERCLLTVDRNWRVLPDVTGLRSGVDTVAQAAALVRGFVDGNAEAEMQSIRAFVEDKTDALTTVTVRFPLPFAPDRMFSTLADVSLWPEIQPAHRSLELRYDDRRHQEFTLEMRTPVSGEAVRMSRHLDAETLTITFFLPESLAMLHQHRGSWRVRAADGGSEVTVRHTVVLTGPVCSEAFGTDDLRTQKAAVRELLAADSRELVEACARWLGGAASGRGEDRD